MQHWKAGNCPGKEAIIMLVIMYWFHAVSTLEYHNNISENESCVEIPNVPPMQSLYIVWPSGGQQDCICPLCDDGNCVLTNCECYSTLAPKLRPTNTSLSYNFCWPVSRLFNNSNVSDIQFYFFYETKNCENNITEVPFLGRKYISYVSIVNEGNFIIAAIHIEDDYY